MHRNVVWARRNSTTIEGKWVVNGPFWSDILVLISCAQGQYRGVGTRGVGTCD